MSKKQDSTGENLKVREERFQHAFSAFLLSSSQFLSVSA
jgi:hypothetical protein